MNPLPISYSQNSMFFGIAQQNYGAASMAESMRHQIRHKAPKTCSKGTKLGFNSQKLGHGDPKYRPSAPPDRPCQNPSR